MNRKRVCKIVERVLDLYDEWQHGAVLQQRDIAHLMDWEDCLEEDDLDPMLALKHLLKFNPLEFDIRVKPDTPSVSGNHIDFSEWVTSGVKFMYTPFYVTGHKKVVCGFTGSGDDYLFNFKETLTEEEALAKAYDICVEEEE